MPGARNSQRDTTELREAKRKSREIAQHSEKDGVMDEDEPDEGQSLLVGEAVKALGDGCIGGYLVRFSGADHPDLVGDYFTPETDFGTISTTNVLYHHGQDAAVKARSLGSGRLRKDDVGVWIEAQLKLANDYEQAIYEMVRAGKLRWSSGTAPHLVKRQPVGKAMWIKSWPLGLDASLTPTPAEPRNAAVAIKSGARCMEEPTEISGARCMEEPTEISGAFSPAGAAEGGTTPSASSDRVEELETHIKAMADQQRQMAEQFAAFMKAVDSAPVQRIGYVSPDGGAADPQVKSLGDFAAAIYRGDEKRLRDVYAVKATLNESQGELGGYMVPPEFERNIMRMATENAIVRPRAAVRTIQGREIYLPAFDYSGDYSTGKTTALAGMGMEWVSEDTEISETTLSMRQMHMVTHKLGGVLPFTRELMRDAGLALEQSITQMFGDAIAYTEDWNFLRGDGVAKPKGVYNADCLVTTGTTLTAATFKLSEILAMFKRLPEESRQRAVWVCHSMLLDALMALNSETQGSVPLIPDASRPGTYRLLGLPVLFTEKVPELTTAGGVLLADFSQYYVVDSGGIEIAMSDHVYFTNDKIAMRVTKRTEGQPLWNAARKVGSGTNSTVSPFVRSK